MDKVKQKCNSAIILSGSIRSGTTIMGKIISSLKGVEYIFESHLLLSLMILIKKIPKDSWCRLYEGYLYEEFLINALAGRNLNHNKNDYSYVLNSKDSKLVKQRLSKTWRKTELEKIADSAQIFCKLANATPYLPEVQKYYPKTKIVIMLRKPNDVFHSIKRMEWFTDKNLKHTNRISPNIIYKGYHIPYFVKEKDWKYFIKSDEISRMAYYYNQVYGNLDKIKNGIFIKYDDLIAAPEKEASRVAKKLNLSFESKTKKIINSVVLRDIDRSENLVDLLDDKLRKKVIKLESKIYKIKI